MKWHRIPIVLFVISLLFLFSVRRVPPIEYWDEHWWIGRGYFFELFIKGDFSHPAWEGYYSYDQPKLAEYAFGALVYPLYLTEKASKQASSSFEFTDFLTENNFYSVSETPPATAAGFINWKTTDGLTIKEALTRYGSEFKKTVDMVLYGRTFSIVLFALSTVIVFCLGVYVLPMAAALLLAGLFVSNTVVVYAGVQATSVALFTFLFLGGLTALLKLFTRANPPISYVVYASIIAALCTQTKLNGIMLVFVYFALLVYSMARGVLSIKKALKQFIVYAAFFIPIFVSLHPFLYPNPVRNSIFLYQWRHSEARANQLQYPGAALRTPLERGRQIALHYYYHVYTNYGMPFVFYQDQYVPYGSRPVFRLTRLLSFFRAISAFVGFIMLWRLAIISVKKRKMLHAALHPSEILAVSTTLIIMIVLNYLLIHWMPYYIVLTFPLLLFEVIGFTCIWNFIRGSFRALLRRSL